jgi:hypothetical protein
VFDTCELFWSDLVRTLLLPNEPVRSERINVIQKPRSLRGSNPRLLIQINRNRG